MMMKNSQNIANPEKQLDDHILTLVDNKWTMYLMVQSTYLDQELGQY